MLNQTTDDKPALTARQKEIYEFLKDKILNRGYGPTVREIGAEFGIRSPNGVMCHLKALEKKGLITRESHMSRAIQLADPPHQRMSLAMAGTISAGAQIHETPAGEKVDFADLFDHETHLCLKVQGNGFLTDQIKDGDHVIIRQTDEVEDGQQVLAVAAGYGTCIRKVYREGDRVRLESPGTAPMFAKTTDVVGPIVGVIRRN